MLRPGKRIAGKQPVDIPLQEVFLLDGAIRREQLELAGICPASSTTWWSSSGTRTSSELYIDATSTLTRMSPGR